MKPSRDVWNRLSPDPILSMRQGAAAALVICAVAFNPLLAVVNAHLMPIAVGHVMLAEVAIVAAAAALLASAGRRIMLPWMALLFLVLAIAVLLGLGNAEFDPKHARDVLIIPIFIMLGMLCTSYGLIKLVLALQAGVLVFLIFEAVYPERFGDLFNVISYYMNTRFAGMDLPAWFQDRTLWFAADRPGDERFLLDSLGIHRLSSVFLEPVSLGNYCIVMTIIILAFWQRLTAVQKFFLSASTAAILIGSDGRLAIVTCLALVAGSSLFPRLPRYTNALYLPVALMGAAVAVRLLGLEPVGDTFSGRIAHGIDALLGLDAHALLGMRQSVAAHMVDSGIAYFVVTQSVVGVGLIWLYCSLGLYQDTKTERVFVHGVSLYIALNLLVSFSLFSIKTASLLWFAYGVIAAERTGVLKRSIAPAKPPTGVKPAAAHA